MFIVVNNVRTQFGIGFFNIVQITVTTIDATAGANIAAVQCGRHFFHMIFQQLSICMRWAYAAINISIFIRIHTGYRFCIRIKI